MLTPLLLGALTGAAHAGEFMDTWVTTALEDDNVRAGPEDYSPGANFVLRGNQTFFDNYEARYTDDISQTHLVLYRADEGFKPGWWSETALVLEFNPYLDPDRSDPGVWLRDDGSYVSIGRDLPGEDHVISVTGYAVNAGRFRLGYSYDLSYGSRNIIAPRVSAMPGVRVQWQRKGSYVFVGAKSAINQRTQVAWQGDRNAAYYSVLGGAGLNLMGGRAKVEVGAGSFQQGQIINVKDTSSPLYGELITALGTSGQVSFRTDADIPWIQSSELRLIRNSPEFMRDSYINHRQTDGFGFLVQAEANRLAHNLLNPDDEASTVIESGLAGDVQTLFIYNTTVAFADLVYKDLSYIVFNIPGLTSGVATSEAWTVTPQIYGRFGVAHHFPNAHLTPGLGVGIMKPASYTDEEGKVNIALHERDLRAIPDSYTAPYNVLSAVGALQADVTPSVVVIGEMLYTKNSNLSRVSEVSDGERVRVPEDAALTNALGFNLMLRARF
ncbi:MAG: hypothetical protein H6741_17010 [Alphaproteobacteria bacterium]|nr:hypothetical protein [Alphaproteobacteria bacterium]MCB9794416.1 hypothetical protein [Alphaproteobacteria bacterium]